MATDTQETVRVKADVRKATYYPGRGRRQHKYVAKVGHLEASADSAAEAKTALASMVTHALDNLASPTVMFDFVEPQTAWVAFAGPHGWGYEIARHRGDGTSRMCGVGGHWTRDECLERMRDHWYQNNAALMVSGIVALCTSWREWSCPRCKSAVRSFAPYVCQSPACGHTL